MGLWQDMQADSLSLFEDDGETVEITSGGRGHFVRVFWQALSLDGGELGGPRFYVVTDDLPSSFTQGDTVTYDSVSYEVTHRNPDGHGLELVTLWSA